MPLFAFYKLIVVCFFVGFFFNYYYHLYAEVFRKCSAAARHQLGAIPDGERAEARQHAQKQSGHSLCAQSACIVLVCGCGYLDLLFSLLLLLLFLLLLLIDCCCDS